MSKPKPALPSTESAAKSVNPTCTNRSSSSSSSAPPRSAEQRNQQEEGTKRIVIVDVSPSLSPVSPPTPPSATSGKDGAIATKVILMRMLYVLVLSGVIHNSRCHAFLNWGLVTKKTIA